jgi:hypothetical protein
MYIEEEGYHFEEQPKADQRQQVFNLRQSDRRLKKSTGYTYIPMVGWMDRREKTRRCVDKLHTCTLGEVDKTPK